MGPLELQLYRELAIQMVRACARLHQTDGGQLGDLEQYRIQFDEMYDRWMTTQRPELGDQTPVQAILWERQELADELGHAEGDATQRVELYTDLPQAEDVNEPIECDSPGGRGGTVADLAPACERLTERGDGADRLNANWRAFCDRYLSDWFDDERR